MEEVEETEVEAGRHKEGGCLEISLVLVGH